MLANLCVVNLYDQKSPPCRFMRDYLGEGSAGNANWANKLTKTLPWIQYSGKDDNSGKGNAATLLSETLASQGYQVVPSMLKDTAQGKSNNLNFKLAQYHLNGTWLGYTDLSSELSICPLSHKDVLNFKRFGVQLQIKCTFPINELKTTPNNLGARREANKFYELYLEDATGKLINVPILVSNYMTEDQKFPNKEANKDQWVFSRRFFIYDTVSGIRPGGFQSADGFPDYIRWAYRIVLKVTMDQDEIDSSKKLLRPYLEVEYREREVSTITPTEQVEANLHVDYFSDYSSTLQSTLIAFIVLTVFAIIFGVLRIFYFFRRNPKDALGERDGMSLHFLMSIYYIIDTWSTFMYAILGVTTMYVTLTYKS